MDNQLSPNTAVFRGRITRIEKYPMQDNVLVQGVKQKDQGYYDCSRKYAGSNGTYIEFGEYHGMALDVKFSLYDTDKKYVNIGEHVYKISKHVKVNIYNQLMQAWGLQRMSPQKFQAIMCFESKKVDLVIYFVENTLEHSIENQYWVDVICAMPFTANDQYIFALTTIPVERIH